MSIVSSLQSRSIRLISDEPPNPENPLALDMEAWAEIVAGVGIGNKGPFTVGLYGKWGSGKSSILMRAAHLSNEESNIHAFVVNAWEHERHDDPFQAILADLIEQIGDTLEDSKNAKKSEKGKANTLAMWQKFLIVLSVTSATVKGLEMIQPMIGDLSQLPPEALLAGTGSAAALDKGLDVAKKLKEAVPEKKESEDTKPITKATLKAYRSQIPEGEKFVIYIDDLDRCQPDKAVQLLECIKHLLWMEGFIFVLALDNSVIEDYLDSQYEHEHKLKDHEGAGRRYLQKLVQLTLPIPASETKFEAYVRGLVHPGTEDELFSETIMPLVIALAKENPRQAKRSLNDLLVDQFIYGRLEKDSDVNMEQMTILFGVNRLLANIPGFAPTLRRLQRDQFTCNTVVSFIDELEIEEFGDEYEFFRTEELDSLVRSILGIFEREGIKFLFEQDGLARIWLTNSEKRKAATEFLASTRVEIGEVQSDQEIVDQAIRNSLGLAEHVRIADEHRNLVKRLDLKGTELRTCTPLKPLTALESLDLHGTHITDVTPLAHLPLLARLDLRGTLVSEVTPLAALTSLRSLNLYGTQVSDVTPLASLTDLTTLYLFGTQVSDVAPLASLTELTTLFLGRTKVTDINPLASLSKLGTLAFGRTNVTDIKVLESLKLLVNLDLHRTQVSNIIPLKALDGLRYLNLDRTRVSTQDIDQLRFDLPNCDILFDKNL